MTFETFDDFAGTMLDPDTSAFTTLLMRLGPPSLTVKLQPGMYVGCLLRDEKTGEAWRVSYTKYVNPDDWFSDEQVAVCHKPWSESRIKQTKIDWLEDELFPRTRP